MTEMSQIRPVPVVGTDMVFPLDAQRGVSGGPWAAQCGRVGGECGCSRLPDSSGGLPAAPAPLLYLLYILYPTVIMVGFFGPLLGHEVAPPRLWFPLALGSALLAGFGLWAGEGVGKAFLAADVLRQLEPEPVHHLAARIPGDGAHAGVGVARSLRGWIRARGCSRCVPLRRV